MCYIDGQKNKYSVLNECNRMLKYNISHNPLGLHGLLRGWVYFTSYGTEFFDRRVNFWNNIFQGNLIVFISSWEVVCYALYNI
jgi:hypothetical protein